jgi:hypothetical protein
MLRLVAAVPQRLWAAGARAPARPTGGVWPATDCGRWHAIFRGDLQLELGRRRRGAARARQLLRGPSAELLLGRLQLVQLVFARG